MNYWKVTTLDGQRLDLPSTYYGDLALLDLIKKYGVGELHWIEGSDAEPAHIPAAITEAVNG